MTQRPEVAQTLSRLHSRDNSNGSDDEDNDRHQSSSGNSNSDLRHGDDNGNGGFGSNGNVGGGNGFNGNGGSNGSNGNGGSNGSNGNGGVNGSNGNSGSGNGSNGNGGGNGPNGNSGGDGSNPNSFGGPGFCSFCVNDNDPRIIYNGAWVLTTNGTGGFDHTTHETSESGSTATFTFNGTGIVVFGTISKSDDTVFPPTVNYTVDAADPVTTQQPFATDHIRNQPLFAVGQLSPEHEHTIVIDVINGSAPYEFDYFYILPRSNVSQTSLDGKHPPTSSTTSFLGGSTGALSGSQQNHPAETVSMTALKATAAALGTLAVILLLTCLFLLFRLRRISRTQKNLQNFMVNPLATSRYQNTYAPSFSSSSKAGSLSGSGGWSRSMSPVLSDIPRTITDTGTIFTTAESILRNYPSTNYTSSTGERSTTYSHGTGLGSLGPASASLHSQSQSRHSQGLPLPVTVVPLPIVPCGAPKVLAQSSPTLGSIDKTRRDSADSSRSAPPGIGSPKKPLSMS